MRELPGTHEVVEVACAAAEVLGRLPDGEHVGRCGAGGESLDQALDQVDDVDLVVDLLEREFGDVLRAHVETLSDIE